MSLRGEVSDKHVNHLVEVFRVEGCARVYDSNHYVLAIISADDLYSALAYSQLRILDLMQDGEPIPILFRGGTWICVLHIEHRPRAAQRFLDPTETMVNSGSLHYRYRMLHRNHTIIVVWLRNLRTSRNTPTNHSRGHTSTSIH
jgi:hypothetical protein